MILGEIIDLGLVIEKTPEKHRMCAEPGEEVKENEETALGFNVQFGKRFGDFLFRVGLFESTGGLGVNYNLLDEKWIPVFMNDGDFEYASVKHVLNKAAEIRCLALGSPLDQFAVHRFLLTLLYWKAGLAGGVDQLRRSLLSGKIPASVIDGIIGESDSFDLFDKEKPFLQDISLSTSKENDKKS